MVQSAEPPKRLHTRNNWTSNLEGEVSMWVCKGLRGFGGPRCVSQGHFTVLWTCPCNLGSMWNLSSCQATETNQAELGFEPTPSGGDCNLNTGSWKTQPSWHMLTWFVWFFFLLDLYYLLLLCLCQYLGLPVFWFVPVQLTSLQDKKEWDDTWFFIS